MLTFTLKRVTAEVEYRPVYKEDYPYRVRIGLKQKYAGWFPRKHWIIWVPRQTITSLQELARAKTGQLVIGFREGGDPVQISVRMQEMDGDTYDVTVLGKTERVTGEEVQRVQKFMREVLSLSDGKELRDV